MKHCKSLTKNIPALAQTTNPKGTNQTEYNPGADDSIQLPSVLTDPVGTLLSVLQTGTSPNNSIVRKSGA
jgi:hypothetical protein